jgi:hypothetical protein
LTQQSVAGLGFRHDDDALRHLSGLTGLRTLDLARTKVTDAGLRHLARRLSQSTIWV